MSIYLLNALISYAQEGEEDESLSWSLTVCGPKTRIETESQIFVSLDLALTHMAIGARKVISIETHRFKFRIQFHDMGMMTQ